MIRKYHNHKLLTTPWHREEEPLNHLKYILYKIVEAVQRRAARWATRDYRYASSVTAMLNDLNWRPLDQRRIDGRLLIMDQESIQTSTTPDTRYRWVSNKLTIRHHTREPRGQPFPSRWPQGNNKPTRMKA